MLKFEIIHQSKKSRARVGRIHTPHGIIDTPNFVPVATNATIKTVDSTIINQLDVQLMFCNTYHLLLHPGTEVVQSAGGLHNFMKRSAPIITDSGGFQVFSLAYGSVKEELKSKGTKKNEGSIIKIDEEGVLFRSYRDGSPVLLTPESSIQAQKAFGADIIVPLDELPPYHMDARALRHSFERTHRWEERSLGEHLKNKNEQAIYAIIHGGVDPALRQKSCEILRNMPFDGFAIGGSLGKTREEMVGMLDGMMQYLPPEQPNHLLGIGDIPSLEQCVPLGIDTFDSSYPTKAARHGVLFHDKGPINIQQNKWHSVLEHVSDAPLCKEYSAAYLHHLFQAHETVAQTLASIHNIHYMMQLMKRYRTLILQDLI